MLSDLQCSMVLWKDGRPLLIIQHPIGSVVGRQRGCSYNHHDVHAGGRDSSLSV